MINVFEFVSMERGMTQENNAGSLPQVMQVTQLPLVANDVCKRKYGGRFVPPAVLCAGNTFGVNDACQGNNIILVKRISKGNP